VASAPCPQRGNAGWAPPICPLRGEQAFRVDIPLEAFLVSTGVVALGEIGDKTQIATAVLAARYPSLAAVVAGTTLGMLVADVPVVLIGNAAAAKIPINAIRIAAALMFAALGIYTLLAVPID
jgi:putative Ca2+/H+ antiporter (TMEM165/GDT1 family)